MPAVLLVASGILLLFGIILYRRFVRAPRYQSLLIRIGAVVGLVAMSAAIFVGFAYQNGNLVGRLPRLVGMLGMTWLAAAFYLLLGAGLSAIVALALRIARRDRAAIIRWHRRSVPVIVVASLAVTGYGVLEAGRLAVTESTVTIPGLPAQLEGYRVAVITDLHAGPVRGTDLVDRAVTLTNRSGPDAVLLVGDLTDGTTAQFGDVLTPLADLAAPDGVYAVTGNHEYYAGDSAGWVNRWRTLGIEPLLNDSATIERDGARLRLAGVNDDAAIETAGTRDGLPAAELLPDLAAALAQVDPQEPTILLAHRPGVAEDPLVRAAGVDLMVSGHTHGGQIWPFTYLVKLANPTVSGLDSIDGTTAYTSRGAGTWGPPTRVLVPAEIPVLTLTAG
ncbi:MAG TPA: metallophosphoesterase [Intrasporangiaceae bacterium]|nr:metallophosphoesterase [Intrasporangiaceae bacterium]